MNHFREYQDLQMIIRTFEGYHEEFIRISLWRHAAGGARKRRQTQQVKKRVLYVYKITASFVFVSPLRIRFAKVHHSDKLWVYLVIEYHIRLMIIIMFWSIFFK